MSSEWTLVAADVLVLAGAVGLTIAIAGVIFVPNIFVKIHAASAAIVIGVFLVLAGAIVAGGAAMATRSLIVAAFLLLTAPVSTHVLVRLADERQQRRSRAGADRTPEKAPRR